MITVENLSMDFTGKAGSAKALSDVSFAISAGEILGIVGKSGAGKTTLLRLLSFQMRPNSGRILIEGEPVDHTTSARALRRIVQQSATVFQGFSLLYNRNVVENVALPLKLRGMSRSLREEKARDLLNFVGLAHRARAYPITLSGGEAQRVAIARALVTDPKILFLDEPTSALDSQTSKDILDLVKRTHQTYGVTIVLVSHQIEVVRYMCDRVLHLEQGRIKRLGPIPKAPQFHVETMEQIWGMPDV